MSRLEAWTQHVANLLVGLTGLVYAWMRYFARSDDPFAVANHPLQPLVQHLHVLSAPLLVFAFGFLFQRHVLARLRSRAPRRPTGIALALTFFPMAASGYLIQTTATDLWRTTWIAIHLATSALWLLGYLAHLAGRAGARRAEPVPEPATHSAARRAAG
jgi:hypothetical protein